MTGSQVGAGTVMAVGAMCFVQIGLAASLQLADVVGAGGVAWIRLVSAALILVVLVRPWRTSFTPRIFYTCVLLGIATAGMTILFMSAITRLSLGTASALEFLGPLGVAFTHARGMERGWALVAGAGVLALTEPWNGTVDPLGVMYALGAAVCWAAYIVLTQRAGSSVEGIQALAVSMPVAALVATFTVGFTAVQHFSITAVAVGLGLALLLPSSLSHSNCSHSSASPSRRSAHS